MPLTPKQERFCQEYIIDLNATRAAKDAGYSEMTADVQGPRLLGNVTVDARIKELQAVRATRTGITQDRVLQEYERLALFDIRKIYNDDGTLKRVSELDDDTAAAVVSVKALANMETEYRLADKRAALDSICKLQGYNAAQRHELTGKDGAPLYAILKEIDGSSADLPGGKS